MDKFEMLVDRLREIARGKSIPLRDTLAQAADYLENQRSEILALTQIVERQADVNQRATELAQELHETKSEIAITKRVKYAGDVHAELLKAGFDLDTATLFVNNLPDADVTPVVRCRDCIHYEPCEGGKDFCCFHATGIVESDFCSYGERKDGDG